jgi:NAD(P)H dehydrogenase (quinone)
MTTVGVTGSTGRVGGRVARGLTDPVLLVRDPSRAPAGGEVRQSSYDEPGSLAGVDVLFMVSAAENVDRIGQHRRMIDAAAAAGVRHVVYTSFQAAAPDSTFTLGRDHWATEQHLLASGMDVTFLRDSLYSDFFPLLAGEDGVIRGPAGDGRVAGVAVADVADAALAVLRDPCAHVGATHVLTGPEALTMTEVAELLQAHGRDVHFENETVEEAYASRAHYGEPDWQVEAWVTTYLAIADGSMAQVSNDLPSLLGRPATSLSQLLGST